jgi:hypothetical protein
MKKLRYSITLNREKVKRFFTGLKKKSTTKPEKPEEQKLFRPCGKNSDFTETKPG